MPSAHNPRMVVLLRGVNVGGVRLTMADFKAALETLGCTEVVTYIASGNAVARTPPAAKPLTASAAAAHWQTTIAATLVEHCGIDVSVVVRSPVELHDALSTTPWPADDHPPKLLHLGFLQSELHPDAEARLASTDVRPDAYWLTPRTIYQRYESGMARSRLATLLTERLLGTPITTRNVLTVQKLIELAS